MTQVEQLAHRTIQGFRARYGHDPTRLAFAPGRVNLIGEHTDYNQGFVLPCALPFGTVVAAGPRADGNISTIALDLDGETDEFEQVPFPERSAERGWVNHVRGMAHALRRNGHVLEGANLAVAGNIPQGAGLSSSASLGIALGMALLSSDEPGPSARTRLARAAQWTENEFVGCACGIMDQLASAHGVEGNALLIDCRTDAIRPVPLPTDAVVMIVHSGVSRGLAESAYNDRRKQCEIAARHFGVPALRDLGTRHLLHNDAGLDPLIFRRARHVVTENERTLAMTDALQNEDFATIGDLMSASHRSLRDDFQVTVPEVDALQAVMQDAIGDAGGARMTGGGFGGCLVALLNASRLAVLEQVLARYWIEARRTSPLQLIIRPSTGARLLRLADLT